MRKHGFWPGAALAGLLVTCLPARADDERSRWSLGLGAGVLSTKDDIRNNAASLLLNERGRPNDISDDLVVNGSIDLRQDDLLGRDTEVEERQTYSFSVAYGLTSWLSLQMDVGRFAGNVSNLDTLRINRRFVDINHDNTLVLQEEISTPPHDASVPISAGRLQEIPVSLSALFRFRKDSPFNPILGAGVGMIFADFRKSDALDELNNQILRGFQRTQLLTTNSGPVAVNRQTIEDRYGRPIADTTCTIPANEFGLPDTACSLGQQQLDQLLASDVVKNDTTGLADYLRQFYAPYINQAFIPSNPFITTQVENAFEYHFVGGAEYHFNEHWSTYFLGRYTFSSANLLVRISDNGNLVTRTQTPDASQRITFETDQARFRFLSESNCDSVRQAQQTAQGQLACLNQPDLLNDVIIVQGGKINLSGFTLGFGMRFTF